MVLKMVLTVMRRRVLPLVVAALGLLLPSFFPAIVQADENAILVPENCWPMAGGSPARSGFTRTRPLRGALHIAWEHKFSGEIEGEPLVWDDTIVVVVKTSESKRVLHLLALKTGESLGKPTVVATEWPLIPSLWRRRLAIRDAGGIALYRVGRMRLTKIWDREVSVCHDLQLIGGTITYSDQRGVVSCEDRTSYPHVESLEKSGSLLVQDALGPHFLSYDDEGNGSWVSGYRDKMFVCHHGGKTPQYQALAALCGDELFIQTSLPMELVDGGTANLLWLFRTGVRSWSLRTLLTTASTPVGSHERRVIRRKSKQGGWQLVRYEGARAEEPRGLILASREIHPELLQYTSMTMAREMLYLGPARIDLETLDLYEPLPVSPMGRVIPARDALLVVAKPGVLVALREGASSRDRQEAAIRPAPTEEGEQKGRVVDAAGRVKKAKLSWAGGVVKVGSKPLAPERVLLARAKDGTIVHAGSVQAARDGLALLIENEEGKGYAKLATAAVKALDGALALRFLAAAEDRGATNDVTKWTRRRMAELIGAATRKKPKKKAVEAALKGESKLLARTTGWIWASYEKLAPQTPWPVRAGFLRAVLERMPTHPGAVAAVRAAIPEGVPLPQTFVAMRWLKLADAVQVDPVRFAAPDGPDRAAIEFARRTWRKDVIALRSANLLILTPDPDPVQIAICLATGEFVCRKLEELLGKAARSDDPLVLHLFQTNEAYLKAAGGAGQAPPDARTKASAGHYSPRLNLSRIFLPTGEDAYASVTRTYQHELAHHWIQARCPLPDTRGVRGHRPRTPGFWVVEGIAELFSEFKFDLRRGEVTTQDRRAASLDLVAHVPAKRRLAWPWFLKANQFEFAKLRVDDVVPVPMHWRVGLRRAVSAMGMFYAQAGATAQYLYHHNDKTRAELVNLVRRYYEGTLTERDLRTVAGLSATELGREIYAYARR